MSLGEAEFYALVKGTAESLGFQSLLANLGVTVTITVVSDSTAAKGTASRIGIGKMKHLDVGCLWVQELVKKGKITVMKVNGKVNPADLLTKPKSAAEAARLSAPVGYGMVIRRLAQGAAESFCGFVKRAMQGDRRGAAEKSVTLDWWYSTMYHQWRGH